MKKFTMVFTVLMFAFTVKAQWLPEMQVGDNNNFGYPVITSAENHIYIFWHDNRMGNLEIYYKLSTDVGNSWSPDVRLTNNAGVSSNPAVCINGSKVHLVWQDNSDGNYEIYYKYSTDGGLNWGNNIRLTNDPGSSSSATVAVAGENLHLTWVDNRDGNNEIYYKRSSDGGLSWGQDTRITNDTTLSASPQISAAGSNIHIVFRDRRTGIYQIYHKRSTDGGNTWSDDFQITNVSNASIGFFVKSQTSSSNVHILWNDNRSGHNELYYRGSFNSGVNWEPEIQLTNTEYSSFNPTLSVSNQNIHIACQRLLGETADIYYRRSMDGGITWEPEYIIANNCFFPSLNASGTNTFAVYIKYISSAYYNYFKKNPTGNLVSVTNINSEIPERFSLFQNYPNPFNPSTLIRYSIIHSEIVSLKIYNALGSEVATLINEHQNVGTYEVEWDAGSFPSGIYFYKLQTENFTATKKMVLTK